MLHVARHGSVDEALIQINTVLVRDPVNVDALTQQAQALRFKALYAQSIDAARKAVKLNPTVAEPHLWMGDSLRLSAKPAESEPEYIAYLKLSNLNSKLAGQLNYYVLGSLIGFGRRSAPLSRTSGNSSAALPTMGSVMPRGCRNTFTRLFRIASRP